MKKCLACGFRTNESTWRVCPHCGNQLTFSGFVPMPLDDVTKNEKIQVFDRLYKWAFREFFERKDNPIGEVDPEYGYEELMSILLLNDETKSNQLWDTLNGNE